MAEKKEKVATEATAETKAPAKKASTKTTTAKASTAKTAADKAPAKKATTAKTTDAPAKKTTAKKTEVKAVDTETVATATVTETPAVKADKAPAKKAAKKSATKAPLYIHGRYIVEKQLPQKPQKGTSPYVAATGKVKVTLVKSTVGCLDDQIATVKALGLTKIRTSNVLPDNAATRGMIFKVKHLVVVEEVK